MKKLLIITLVILIITVAGIVAFLAVNNQKESPNTVGQNQINNKNSSQSEKTDAQQDGDEVFSPNTGIISVHSRSDEELQKKVIETSPSLLATDNLPNFKVLGVKRVEKTWYIVKIENIIDPTIGVAWIILQDRGDLVKVAGPGTSFPPAIPIPDSVRKEIQ